MTSATWNLMKRTGRGFSLRTLRASSTTTWPVTTKVPDYSMASALLLETGRLIMLLRTCKAQGGEA